MNPESVKTRQDAFDALQGYSIITKEDQSAVVEGMRKWKGQNWNDTRQLELFAE